MPPWVLPGSLLREGGLLGRRLLCTRPAAPPWEAERCLARGRAGPGRSSPTELRGCNTRRGLAGLPTDILAVLPGAGLGGLVRLCWLDCRMFKWSCSARLRICRPGVPLVFDTYALSLHSHYISSVKYCWNNKVAFDVLPTSGQKSM